MARRQQYVVTLTLAERQQLLALLKQGSARARTRQRANILLGADEGRPDDLIADTVHVSIQTVRNIRKRFAIAGLEAALYERPRSGAARNLDANHEAFLIALACSESPGGRETWTMQLLADRLVALQRVESISDETVRRTLKKTSSSPGRRNSGALAM
jgi:transposase